MKIGKGVLSFLFAAVLVGVTGCGDSGEGAESAPETSSAAAESTDGGGSAEDGSSEGGSAQDGSSEDGSAEEVVITVEDFEYSGPESVSPGATITVVNKDEAPHTVTSEEDGIFDAVFEGGETVTFTAPEEPGEYPYFCVYHPNMTGTLVVE